MIKPEKKIPWKDFYSATQDELRKTYKVNQRQLENSARSHLDGASESERREFYQQFYGRRE